MQRITKEEAFFNTCKAWLKRSTCLRRQYVAVLVKEDRVVSIGYNGSPRGEQNCNDGWGWCARQGELIGHGYEKCRSVHAEMNAVLNAAREGISTLDTEMYLVGYNLETGEYLHGQNPCELCRRILVNAGVKEVHVY